MSPAGRAVDAPPAAGRRSAARAWALDLTLAAVVALVAVLPRAKDLDVFLSPDETRWFCRSTNFYAALEQGDFASTYQKEHPGVITMWLGSLGMRVDPSADYAVACRDIPASQLVSAVPHATLDVMRDRLFAGRLRVALAVALGIAGIALVVVRLLGRGPGLLAGLLVAWDPFFLAHARVLHVDAVTATLMTVSLLLLVLALRRGLATGALVLSGAAAGLAALNKSPAMALGPMAVLLVAVVGVGTGAGRARTLRALAAWCLPAVVTYVALWPAMWVTPVQAVTGVLRGAMGYAEEPHEGSNYFWGAIRPDPGPAFYAVSALWRLSPITCVGLLLAAWRLRLRRLTRAETALALTLCAYAVLFGVFMTAGAKKFDRYLLPVFPALDIVAAVGLAGLVPPLAGLLGRVGRRPPQPWAAWSSMAIGAGVLGAALALPHHPYYLSFYNPLVGGSRTAGWALLVGWGEGIDQSAAYLNQQPDAADLTVATRYRSAFAPLFRGRALEMDDYDPASLDYYLLYVNQVQRDLDPELIARLGAEEPAHVARSAGIDYAWLYANDAYKEVAHDIDARSQPGDAIVVRADSRLARLYEGPLAVVPIDQDATSQQLYSVLEQAFQRYGRLWYVRYPDLVPRPGLAAADYELATRTFTLQTLHMADCDVALRTTVGRPEFGAADPMIAERADFGDTLRLEGLALSSLPAEWGRDLGVTFQWRLTEATARNLTVFLHLIGPDGRRWSQSDAPVAGPGLERTSSWPAGKAQVDRHHVSIPAGAPPGDYTLQIGVYDESGKRLAAEVGGTASPDDVLGVPVEVARPRFRPPTEALGLAEVVDRQAAPGVTWLGYGTYGPVVGGEDAPLTLVWRADAAPHQVLRAQLTVRDASGATVGTGQFDLADPSFLPDAWEPGDIVRGWQALPLDGRAVAGTGQLSLRLVDGAGAAAGRELDAPLQIDGPQRSYAVTWPLDGRTDARLGNAIALVGYELGPGQARAGETLPVTLTWRTDRLLEQSYTVFVHVLDASGNVVAQADRPPGAGSHPTNAWLPGEVVADRVDLTLPTGLAAGPYRLEAGMYRPDTLERLAAWSNSGQRLPGDAVPLTTLRVAD